jgi:hypothetical protein
MPQHKDIAKKALVVVDLIEDLISLIDDDDEEIREILCGDDRQPADPDVAWRNFWSDPARRDMELQRQAFSNVVTIADFRDRLQRCRPLGFVPAAAAAASTDWIDERPVYGDNGIEIGRVWVVRASDETQCYLRLEFSEPLNAAILYLVSEDRDLGFLKPRNFMEIDDDMTDLQQDLDLLDSDDALFVTSIRTPSSKIWIVDKRALDETL